MKKYILIAAMTVVAACGTVEGIGEDISASSRIVRDAF